MQSRSTCDHVAVSAAGCVIVIVCEVEQPPLFVAVTVYVPGPRLFAVCPVPPDGLHAYEYVPEGLGVIVALPLLLPKQETFVVVDVDVGEGAIVTLMHDCGPGPHAPEGVQQIWPGVLPARIVIVLVPCPEVIAVPAGTVQV